MGPYTPRTRGRRVVDGRNRPVAGGEAAIDPVAHSAERSISTLLDQGSIPAPGCCFFFRPDPTLTVTLTLTDDRPPIEMALVKF